jgi:AbrB family looped-hinge helix DNA binding protein
VDIPAKVTAKGQITLPIEVRKALDLMPGDRVIFRVTDGRVRFESEQSDTETARGGEMKKVPDFFDLAGSVTTPDAVDASNWASQRDAAWAAELRDRL